MQVIEAKESSPSIQRLQFSEVISAMSYALDLTEGQPAGHCIRSCWIGCHIGKRYGMDQQQLWRLYYTLLLKDAGCSSNAARLCELYGNDDRITKHDFKTVDTNNLAQLVKFVLTHTGVKGNLAECFKRIYNLALHGEQLTTELITTRCERGADIALRLGLDMTVANGIRSLDEHWDGRGKPDGIKGEIIPINARIALLAQVIDVFYQIGGMDAVIHEVRKRNATWFDPSLVVLVEQLTKDPPFWDALQSNDIEQAVLALEPSVHEFCIDDDRLDEIAKAFGQVVDSKSPYTAGHSKRVALYTDRVAVKMDVTDSRRRWLKRGALLHDLGKLGVSNSILDKPGKLTEEEWKEIRMHPVYTEEILSRITPFKELAIMSGAHHERLDGKGYPKGLRADEITLETRIITTCDIFDAITADRPYRGPIPIPEAMDIMGRMVGTALDKECFQALQDCVDALQTPSPHIS